MTKLANAFLGNDGAGNFGARISRSGVDVWTAEPLDLLFSSDMPIMGLAEEGQMTVPANPGGTLPSNTTYGTYMFAQDFGYIPFVLVTCFAGPKVDEIGVFSGMAGFAFQPGPSFHQQLGFVTLVYSDRLEIKNIYGDASQSFGISVFWKRSD